MRVLNAHQSLHTSFYYKWCRFQGHQPKYNHKICFSLSAITAIYQMKKKKKEKLTECQRWPEKNSVSFIWFQTKIQMKGEIPASYEPSQVRYHLKFFGFVFFPLYMGVFECWGKKTIYLHLLFHFRFISDLLEFWNSNFTKNKRWRRKREKEREKEK